MMRVTDLVYVGLKSGSEGVLWANRCDRRNIGAVVRPRLMVFAAKESS